VPSEVMRAASQVGTRPPCSGKSAVPERFIVWWHGEVRILRLV
jgi:hypothetical protein